MSKLGVGIYGRNGHQIHEVLAAGHPEAVLAAESSSLDELLGNPRVELVSLCSPRRADQARDTIRCLRAGKHVYAEKPCALIEEELDEIIAVSNATGRQFREMGGTYLQPPYREVRAAIRDGLIGEVAQIIAQKSYPWAEWRPADEAVDGGLARQVGVYIARFVEHVAGQKIAAIELSETARAAAFLIRMENGGVASAICNYLNPMGPTRWGWESVRVFGSKGAVESDPLRLILTGQPPQELPVTAPVEDYFSSLGSTLYS